MRGVAEDGRYAADDGRELLAVLGRELLAGRARPAEEEGREPTLPLTPAAAARPPWYSTRPVVVRSALSLPSAPLRLQLPLLVSALGAVAAFPFGKAVFAVDLALVVWLGPVSLLLVVPLPEVVAVVVVMVLLLLIPCL